MSSAGGSDGKKAAPAPQERPRVFGPYQLLAQLAEGGMGSVHLARRTGAAPDLSPLCVVKRLRRDLARQPVFVRRFEDEARVVVTLRHPALCPVFDVGRVDDEHYLAMEFVEGVDLRALQDALREAGARLDPAVALAILDDVLDALAYVHGRVDVLTGQPLAIVHRDVSPQNIMLTFQGATRLIDFGVVTSALRTERTVAGVVVGKLAYMAPEQARGEAVDARTDVYAAAIVLWELLVGRRFYDGVAKARLTRELTEGTWQPALDEVPPSLRAALQHALQPEPVDRTPSAADFASALVEGARAGGLVRASARDVRALLQRVCAGQATQLQERLRSAQATPAPVASTVPERTVVTTLARSSDGPDRAVTADEGSAATADPALVRTMTHTPPAAPAGASSVPRGRRPNTARRPDRRVLAAGAGVASAAALVLLAVALRLVGPPKERRSETMAASVPTTTAPTTTAPTTTVPTTTVPTTTVPTTTVPTTTAPKRRLPPAPDGQDLGAQLDFVARHCSSLPCARDLRAARGRIPLLDVAGLTALREQATRCVTVCRR